MGRLNALLVLPRYLCRCAKRSGALLKFISLGLYVPMDVVVQNSLSHALKAEGVAPSLHAGIINKVMEKYHSLDFFPDSAGFLQQLRNLTPCLAKTGAQLDYVIFSNGTPKLVETAISSSDILTKTFAGDGTKKYVSVDGSKAYKPSPKVYEYLLARLGVDGADGVYLVSANPFDIIGAKNAGLGTIWVNRSKTLGWVDMLLGEEDHGPDYEVQSLGGIISLLTVLE